MSLGEKHAINLITASMLENKSVVPKYKEKEAQRIMDFLRGQYDEKYPVQKKKENRKILKARGA